MRSASRALDELGGITRVEASGDRWTISSAGCPLADLVGRRPEACLALEALVAELTQLPVREACERGGRPACRFELAAPARPAQGRRKT